MNKRITVDRQFVVDGDSSRSTAFASPSKKRRCVEKKVVSVAMKDLEGGFRLKGDQISAPPSDSWAWRKYGQKPIKGSPYPRGYYKCSTSKGCPARKQVERSRLDSQMLVVTYYFEHNHDWPMPSRNNHRASVETKLATSFSKEGEQIEEEEKEEKITSIDQDHPRDDIVVPDYRFSDLGEGTLIQASEFGWLTDFEGTSNCSVLESRINVAEDIEMATLFTMPEEDETLFADLGELPECSAVFRRGMMSEHRRGPSLAPPPVEI